MRRRDGDDGLHLTHKHVVRFRDIGEILSIKAITLPLIDRDDLSTAMKCVGAYAFGLILYASPTVRTSRVFFIIAASIEADNAARLEVSIHHGRLASGCPTV